ncbi:MAG: type II toxin-antitoxin system VapC family toxin [Tepidiformaceae bacterium]
MTPIAEQATTSITVGELLHGAMMSNRQEFLERRILELLTGAPLRVLPFDMDAAREYAAIRARLQRAGTPIGDADLRIAAIVKSADGTLVTGNERHFERVDGLLLENWIR